MNKKVMYAVAIILALVLTLAGLFMYSQSTNKQLTSTVDKVFYAYSSFIIDMGYAPTSIKELYDNTTNVAKWKGPYVSKSTLDDYSAGQIDIIKASNIPTKTCSLDTLTNCYTWIKVTNFTSSQYNDLKSAINENVESFFANQTVFFKVSTVE